MNTPTPRHQPIPPLERALAVLAAAACLFITIAVWRSVSQQQGMWPLPALYFIELPGLAITTAIVFLGGRALSTEMAWITAGISGAFAFMGLFSVGLLYIPIFLMYFLLAVLSTSRHHHSFVQGLAAFVVAAAAQAGFMLLAIRLLFAAG